MQASSASAVEVDQSTNPKGCAMFGPWLRWVDSVYEVAHLPLACRVRNGERLYLLSTFAAPGGPDRKGTHWLRANRSYIRTGTFLNRPACRNWRPRL
ncbi:hypothetical protein MESS2_1000007 [Mesorhizobium metallidurans STM 2683]|uniref:Uncharacterized protein n=1 Tax=Mesorhizobium metallidurans STM 2683 TaxID=1297569 RepID=M5EFN2_9HYPH|nr:hypothetical protein MESS2_1000007 [Mesorhizobium metallidurans STM 2683]